ncbi:BT_3928 family protein [Nafulsella turpanensis]|uniref:BT_3928 family protein n=1 Tax=Nafulsella turpanensis TaxID=1265690 RepID=UPI0003473194|nr:BT_3928 family protein [Nafulsella turpanensis]
MNKVLHLFRYLVGILFIISGLIKVNDPVGTQIKLEEYFQVFASDFSDAFLMLVPYALILSVFLSVLEVVLGVALLVRFKMKLTTTVLLLMIVFFTFLTFFSAYFNKVTDCGCFGDALKLTPWQSFTKDIVLLIMIGVLFFYRNRLEKPEGEKKGLSAATIAVVVTAILCTVIGWYAIAHLPFIDFRTYKEGNNIGELMQPSEPYRYTYIMVKDGKEYEFEKYPEATEGYEYKAIKLQNPEAQPVINDFSAWNEEGDYTAELLKGNKLLVIVHAVDKAETEPMADIKQLTQQLEGSAESLVLTSSGAASFDAFRHEQQLALPYYLADATLLKTMIRSNPGLILLKDGVVVKKWHYNDVPEAAEVKELLQ